MKELSEKEYGTLGATLATKWYHLDSFGKDISKGSSPLSFLTDRGDCIALGRAAYEAVAPILLAEPSENDLSIAHDTAMRDPKPLGNFRGGWEACVSFYSARLRNLTAKPDPRQQLLSRWVSEADMPEVLTKLAEIDAARNAGK